MKWSIITLSLIVCLFLVNFASADYQCYQESANTTNQLGIDGHCDLNYTGIYSNKSTEELYINYTKPIFSQSAKWDIKFGANNATTGIYWNNVTIPYDCFNIPNNKIALKIISTPYTSTFMKSYCYNSSSWINIANASYNTSGSASGSATSLIQNVNNGNWSDYICSYATDFWSPDCSGNSESNRIYEEAMIWYNFSAEQGTLTSTTFLVQDSAGGTISGANVEVSRFSDGDSSFKTSKTTDSSGSTTFDLNASYTHYVTVSKPGYVTQRNNYNMAQTSYVIVLIQGNNSIYNNSIAGINYVVTKSGTKCYNTDKLFEFNVTSMYCNLQNASLVIKYSNGTILNQTSSTSPCGSNLSVSINSTNANGQILFGHFYVTIDGVTTLIDPARWTFLCVDDGGLSVKSFFENLRTYESDNLEKQYTTMFWFFLIMFMLIGSLTYATGVELSSPGLTTLLVMIVMGVASYAGFLNLDLVVGEISPVKTFMNQWALFLVTAFISGGFLLGRMRDT